jgi:hypothetical protein
LAGAGTAAGVAAAGKAIASGTANARGIGKAASLAGKEAKGTMERVQDLRKKARFASLAGDKEGAKEMRAEAGKLEEKGLKQQANADSLKRAASGEWKSFRKNTASSLGASIKAIAKDPGNALMSLAQTKGAGALLAGVAGISGDPSAPFQTLGKYYIAQGLLGKLNNNATSATSPYTREVQSAEEAGGSSTAGTGGGSGSGSGAKAKNNLQAQIAQLRSEIDKIRTDPSAFMADAGTRTIAIEVMTNAVGKLNSQPPSAVRDSSITNIKQAIGTLKAGQPTSSGGQAQVANAVRSANTVMEKT